MRTYLTAAGLSSIVDFTTAVALHAPTPTVSVAAAAGVTALAAWLSAAQSTSTNAGLALSNPA